MNGADLLAVELKRQGVEWISTLSGNGLLTFYPSCVKAGIRLIDVRNEQAAAYMADAYARLTGRVGVCAVSSGVAHNNALTGLANAYFDGAPVMLITGATPGYGTGRNVFQEFDQVGLAKPICKYAAAVNRPSDLAFQVRQAFAAAMNGRRGPVHLTIPQDVLDQEAQGYELASDIQVQKLGPAGAEQIRRVVGLLDSSKRPLLLAGTNLFYAGDPSAMIRFCEVTCTPIVVPIWDRGVIERCHPNFVGFAGAASGGPNLLADADLIVVAGARVDYRVGYLNPPATREDCHIIRIDIDPEELWQGIEPEVAILASPPLVFSQLTEAAESHGGLSRRNWLNEARERWRLFRSTMIGPASSGGAMTGRHIIEAIYPLLTEDVVFLVDGGNIGQWAHMLADGYPSHWLTCGASAVVGWGIPGAMGAKLAYPNRPVLLLSGDGAFGFTLGELEAATRQGLAFVAVVAVDEAWGLVVSDQRRLLGDKGVIASKHGEVGYDRVAQALGANGMRVDRAEELGSAIREGFAADRPTVIHVPIEIGGPADR